MAKLHFIAAGGNESYTTTSEHIVRTDDGGVELQLSYFAGTLEIVKLDLTAEEALNIAAKIIHEVEMKLHREARKGYNASCEDCNHARHSDNCPECLPGEHCNPHPLGSTLPGWEKLS